MEIDIEKATPSDIRRVYNKQVRQAIKRRDRKEHGRLVKESLKLQAEARKRISAAKEEARKKRIAEKEAELKAKIEAKKTAPKSKWELRADKMNEAGKNIQNLGDKTSNIGASLTRKITIPIVIFFVGLFTLPFGLLIWLVAFLYWSSRYKK